VLDKRAKAQVFTNEEGGWGAFDTEVKRKKPSRPPPRRPPPPRPPPRPAPPGGDTPQVQVDYASGRTTPSVIIKAPSSESIKSWNVTQADILIQKVNIEAIEAHALLEGTEDDPFDTKQFEGIVAELKEKEVDPFDTSTTKSDPGPCELKQIEKELLETDVDQSKSKDPFDTEFVEDLLPNKGDPFNTEHIEEEEEEIDPFDTTVADAVLPGVRKPTISQKSVVSIEDDNFDPEASFQTKKAPQPPVPDPKTTDPFFTQQEQKKPTPPVPVRQPVKPKYNPYARKRPQTLQEKDAIAEAERLKLEAEAEAERKLQEDDDDDFDFDPRAKTPSPEPEPEPPTPESPDPFDTDGVDPFDTSAVGLVR